MKRVPGAHAVRGLPGLLRGFRAHGGSAVPQVGSSYTAYQNHALLCLTVLCESQTDLGG